MGDKQLLHTHRKITFGTVIFVLDFYSIDNIYY